MAISLLLVLPGCTRLQEQTPGHLAVRSAALRSSLDGAVLDLDLDCVLSGPMRDALDHGIPLTLDIDLRAGSLPGSGPRTQARDRVVLRYYPLSQRYQLQGPQQAGGPRSFAVSAYLIDALASLRLDLPATFAALPRGTPLHVTIGLDRAALPGALRLPAWFEPAWSLSTDYAWSSAG
ncbi:MAG: DUF4390 domain-containing protein [Rhodanobacteraceae bacterium]